ncbi:MAG: phosphoribosylglycinamide formyltransferase [Blastocatellia bacterium]
MNVGILISGRGSNMAAIASAVSNGEIPGCRIAVVVSDRPDAAGIEIARGFGIETAVISRRGRSREEHDAEIIEKLKQFGVDFVCLAGYMRLLSPLFVETFPRRILNIHPSLLPAFPGLDAQKQAIEHGVKVSGCTVHFVNEDLDAGPILLQIAVEVLEDDTPEKLGARILKQEHRAYVEALKLIAGGKVKIFGNRVQVDK